MSDSWHRARVEQQLRDANASLESINTQLWEQNQPPEVRAARQAERANTARAMTFGFRVVFGLVVAWVVVSLMFGRAGQHVLGSLLSFAWEAFNVLLVLGAVVWVGRLVVRGGRAVARVGRAGGDSGNAGAEPPR